MKYDLIPIWMTQPMEGMTSQAIRLLCDGDNETSKLDRANVMIVRVPCQ